MKLALCRSLYYQYLTVVILLLLYLSYINVNHNCLNFYSYGFILCIHKENIYLIL